MQRVSVVVLESLIAWGICWRMLRIKKILGSFMDGVDRGSYLLESDETLMEQARG